MSNPVTDLEEYRRFVEANATKPDAQLIVTRDGERAAIVVEQLFRVSRQRVDVLTGALDKHVYGTPGVISAATQFFRGNEQGIVRVLSERAIDESHPLLTAIRGAGYGERLNVMPVPEALQATYPYHFMIGDGVHFRFAPDRHGQGAFVKFGDSHGGEPLQSAFEDLYRKVHEFAPEQAYDIAQYA